MRADALPTAEPMPSCLDELLLRRALHAFIEAGP